MVVWQCGIIFPDCGCAFNHSNFSYMTQDGNVPKVDSMFKATVSIIISIFNKSMSNKSYGSWFFFAFHASYDHLVCIIWMVSQLVSLFKVLSRVTVKSCSTVCDQPFILSIIDYQSPLTHFCYKYPHNHIIQQIITQGSNHYDSQRLAWIPKLLITRSISHPPHWSSE